jgi:hypothetical protein
MEKPVCISCGGQEFEKGNKGATRSAADFGKIIPGARVIESSQQKQVETISGKPLVVATPGAIPDSDNGYVLAVVDQPQSFLSRESLRALDCTSLTTRERLSKNSLLDNLVNLLDLNRNSENLLGYHRGSDWG